MTLVLACKDRLDGSQAVDLDGYRLGKRRDDAMA